MRSTTSILLRQAEVNAAPPGLSNRSQPRLGDNNALTWDHREELDAVPELSHLMLAPTDDPRPVSRTR
jgi:hypothetical protein